MKKLSRVITKLKQIIKKFKSDEALLLNKIKIKRQNKDGQEGCEGSHKGCILLIFPIITGDYRNLHHDR